MTTALVVTPDSDYHYLTAVRCILCQAGQDLERDILQVAKMSFIKTIVLIHKEVARRLLSTG